MKKTETIEAINKLIKKYKLSLKRDIMLGSLASCPLCKLPKRSEDGDPDCTECINDIFRIHSEGRFPCVERTWSYNLDWHSDKKNLIKYWTSVKAFLSLLEEDINIEDIKPHILEIAKLYKK